MGIYSCIQMNLIVFHTEKEIWEISLFLHLCVAVLTDIGYKNVKYRSLLQASLPVVIGIWRAYDRDTSSWRRVFVLNTLRPRQNGRYFPDDIFKCIFLNENVLISIKIPLKFVPKGPVNNILALFQIMAWRRPGDKPLSETMMVTLLTHICVTRPQWVK